MKWGTKYGPEYVNRLYAMVRRHLRGDFHFVCLTDDAKGIRAEVQCLPIPPLNLPAGIPERGWNKLATFSADLHGLRGTALFLDVDVVITGSLDDFFTLPGDFRIIHDYPRFWRTAFGHELIHVAQRCDAPAPIDEHRDIDHANWTRSGLARAMLDALEVLEVEDAWRQAFGPEFCEAHSQC